MHGGRTGNRLKKKILPRPSVIHIQCYGVSDDCKKLWQDDECISTKEVIAVTVKTDILLSQSSVCVSVLIEHLPYRATSSNSLLAIPKKTDGSD